VDEILVAQVLPGLGLVELPRGGGEGAHPLHRDARRVERVRRRRRIVIRPFHLPQHAVDGRQVRAHRHRELGVAQRGGELGAQGTVGHLQVGGPASRELQTEVDQHLEGDIRVRPGILRRGELDVHEAGRQADPDGGQRPAYAAVRVLDPGARADQPTLPGLARTARQSHETIDECSRDR
jgi:hypothetical protein